MQYFLSLHHNIILRENAFMFVYYLFHYLRINLAELGDYNPTEHVGNYVSQFKILLNQTPKLEEKIAQVHKTLKSGRFCAYFLSGKGTFVNFYRGQTPAEGDVNFLKKACTLDTYGYYPYTIKVGGAKIKSLPFTNLHYDL